MAAFAFDCELEERDENFKIHCTSSHKYWVVKRKSKQDFQTLQQQLSDADSLRGKVELPQFDIGEDTLYFETYLNKLVSNAVILRQPQLHDFLDVPAEVRGTLEYITERPDGEILVEGSLIKHYQKVERDGVNRYFKMTADAKGATLRFYDNEYSQNAVGAMRISGQTKIAKERSGRQYTFTLDQRGRQWIVSAPSESELFKWMSRIEDRIRQAGARRGGAQRAGPIKVDSNDPEQVLLAQLRLENEQLSGRVQLNENKLHELTLQLEGFQNDLNKGNELRKQAAEKRRAELQEELSVMQDNYDHIRKNLRDEVDRLEREKEAQPALAEGKKGLMSWFGGGDDDSEDEEDQKASYAQLDADAPDEKASEIQMATEQKVQVEMTEQEKMRHMSEDERGQIQMVHRHWNKHSHTHTHIHRHTHIHVDDESGAIDNYPNTHYFRHVLTHTSGKMTVKKRGLF